MNTARPRNNLVYLLIIVAIGAIIFTALRTNTPPSEDVPLSEVAALINAGKAKEILVSGDDVRVETGGSDFVTSHKDSSSDLASQLNDLGVEAAKLAAVKYIVDRPPEWGSLLSTIELPAASVDRRRVDLFHVPAGAGHQQSSHVVWQEPRAHVYRRASYRDV